MNRRILHPIPRRTFAGPSPRPWRKPGYVNTLALTLLYMATVLGPMEARAQTGVAPPKHALQWAGVRHPARSPASLVSGLPARNALLPAGIRGSATLALPVRIHSASPILVETAIPDTVLNARQRDRWLGFDKLQHFTFSFLFTVGSQYALVNKLDVRERSALPVSIGVSSVLGLGKELYDVRLSRSRYFSKRDLVVDALGIALAAGFILL